MRMKTCFTYFFKVHASHASHASHTSHASHASHTSHTSHTSHASHASHASHTIGIKVILIGRTILFVLVYPSVKVGFDEIISDFREARPVFRFDIFLLEFEIETTRTENF